MKKTAKMINVKLVRYEKSSALVEYFDEEANMYRQVILNADLVNTAQNREAIPVPAEQLEYAMQYGIPWELFTTTVVIKGEDIAAVMYKNKIYTKEEFEADPGRVIGLVHELATPILQQLNFIVQSVSSKENTDV